MSTSELAPPRAPGQPAQPPAVELSGIVKRFGSTTAVDDVSLSIAPGELLTLVGPSGCGKSTLLRMVAGLMEPDSGEIHLAGRPVFARSVSVPPEERSVGLVFQENTLFPHLNVRGNIAFGLKGQPKGRVATRVAEVLDLVELSSFGKRFPHELSGGERQRVALARALAPEPTVLLLDEPFANLDPNLRSQVRGQTVEILRRAGASVLFVTHDQLEAMSLGDRVAVMGSGRVKQVGSPKSVFHFPTSRFVASSLGEAYFLPVTLCGNGRIDCEAGHCAYDCQPTHDRMEIMVRPHDVTFQVDPEGRGKVVGVEFQGAHILYKVQLPSGRRLRCQLPHTTDVPLGTAVSVELAHGHDPVVLPAQPEPDELS
ncbi:MAG: ABC transporter ATP-binding protein [Actinomycetota bacterium]